MRPCDENSIEPHHIDKIVGKTLNQDLSEGQYLQWNHIDSSRNPRTNESDYLCYQGNSCDVFVVDDHSSDETFNLANKAGGKVYKNQGKSDGENALIMVIARFQI